MKTVKGFLVGAIVMAALGATSYAGTVGVSSVFRGTGGATVAPPSYYTGSTRSETINGSNRNDVIAGLGGDDVLNGGRGNDILRGGAGDDRLTGGPGRDLLFGGLGDDMLFARDGERDVIDGGPGSDRAWVDRFDVIRHVERVYR